MTRKCYKIFKSEGDTIGNTVKKQVTTKKINEVSVNIGINIKISNY